MYSGDNQVNRFGATILDPLGLRLSPEEKTFFREADPFGFILFARNIDSADQIRALCNDLRDAVGRAAPITIDQEGGRVQRLRPPLATDWLAPLDHAGAAGSAAQDAMYLRYRIIAHELCTVGVDSNCAPLVDVATSDTHPFLQNRCYGFDAETVANLGRAVADGLLDGGVLPVLKHIPGHGRAVVDSHLDLPSVSADRATLDRTDFAPFRALNDLPLGMTAHLVYDQIDPRPATLSPVMMRLIRDEIGFDGLIMTDDISMQALKGDLSDLSRAAIAAGCDVILHCNGTLDEKRTVVEAAGRLSDAGQVRAQRAIDARHDPDEVDISALRAKLDALLNGRGHG
ncbi:Beta-hexosaminidase [Thalassovita gelatinovora]|uniref:beta-N-acetylhexosaminidase n=1 Tax=Thalassovita gelatinovora TaxID=53501 RepID=A0A0P1G2V5_THAGE|nr:beta-N-acetylhexosaminidase [Thalassovita gelatinovora]QIZ79650.1 beta-N-acetylhexosaminidase [Thalassovita gelatinovora]CUH66608.1 Beta-hexosaminidase [Thalassovita gelatinovora]SEQ38937.1 beta-N-acetylhexosaminidase [Thalassovita gelatinovora]